MGDKETSIQANVKQCKTANIMRPMQWHRNAMHIREACCFVQCTLLHTLQVHCPRIRAGGQRICRPPTRAAPGRAARRAVSPVIQGPLLKEEWQGMKRYTASVLALPDDQVFSSATGVGVTDCLSTPCCVHDASRLSREVAQLMD